MSRPTNRHCRRSQYPRALDLRRSRSGFTLVEVLTVIIIIGIASAIVVPHMVRSGQMNAQAAARMLISDILIAQNDAIAHQQTRRIVFESSHNRYRITNDEGITIPAGWRSGGDYITDFTSDRRFDGVVIENVDFGSDGYLEFDDIGSPTRGGSVEIASRDQRYRIRVSDMTGRVTIDRLE